MTARRKRFAPSKHEETAHTKACRDYDASVRSAWEVDYAGPVAAARAGNAERLLLLLRAGRPHDEHLVGYMEELHRRPGLEADSNLREKALEADGLLRFFGERLRLLGRKTVPDELRQWIYEYVCGIDLIDSRNSDVEEQQLRREVEKLRKHMTKTVTADPRNPDAAHEQQRSEVEKLREHMRKGRHRSTSRGVGHRKQQKHRSRDLCPAVVVMPGLIKTRAR